MLYSECTRNTSECRATECTTFWIWRKYYGISLLNVLDSECMRNTTGCCYWIYYLILNVQDILWNVATESTILWICKKYFYNQYIQKYRMYWVSDRMYSRVICLVGSITHCNTLQHTATHCNTLQHAATCCNTLQHTATCCNTQIRNEGICVCMSDCNTLPHTATHCSTLQHTATHCNTLQHTD